LKGPLLIGGVGQWWTGTSGNGREKGARKNQCNNLISAGEIRSQASKLKTGKSVRQKKVRKNAQPASNLKYWRGRGWGPKLLVSHDELGDQLFKLRRVGSAF